MSPPRSSLLQLLKKICVPDFVSSLGKVISIVSNKWVVVKIMVLFWVP